MKKHIFPLIVLIAGGLSAINAAMIWFWGLWFIPPVMALGENGPYMFGGGLVVGSVLLLRVFVLFAYSCLICYSVIFMVRWIRSGKKQHKQPEQTNEEVVVEDEEVVEDVEELPPSHHEKADLVKTNEEVVSGPSEPYDRN